MYAPGFRATIILSFQIKLWIPFRFHKKVYSVTNILLDPASLHTHVVAGKAR